ncbi:Adenylosuccinate synthase [Alkaliphilus metalliredigens QYMF]|uniref:Adenylosuccinate synthetase n=1 Tax=Alkaliphilus metalliredigens (strain QYMF) TaxID=293826 RepID=PURA_ALKMQ|nr:RecName: Full=Adenylosuccinate synthetase; Short=AMPSase; Short=AdSS; AltName: Full=IMP--aspartate ligase [Alkaliphilus metalliredigens QYMF]ABR50831.1 Adenylosuccinate synthase [Alkaliphilus metalliredigens QYMF]
MPSIVIVGAQWGDEGKGKIIDYLAQEADVVIRAQGGNNAGHTVMVEDKKYSFHLLPSGVLFEDKLNIIGNGVVFDPEGFLQEIEVLKKEGINTSNIKIDERVHVIFPYHKRIDQLEEEARGEAQIGTTKKGIGPCYMDKIQRSGIRLGEMIDEEDFKDRLYKQVDDKNKIIEKIYEAEGFEKEAMYETYLKYAREIKKYVTDTTILAHEALKAKKKVLFEGAQGTLLDIDLGTYPYVTSSHPTAGGFPIGAGIGPNQIEQVLGIVKAYTTRVGSGTFPTELDNEVGDKIRIKGNEFGTTTGRPRRCGWFDGVMVRYTTRINGLTAMSLMLLDVLSGFDTLKICTGYELEGEMVAHFPANIKTLGKCKPIYEELPGWEEDITNMKTYEELPENAKKYIERIESYVGVPIKMISVGPKRNQTIIRERLF